MSWKTRQIKVADVLFDFKSQRAYKESVPCSSRPHAESGTRRKATRPSFGLGARSCHGQAAENSTVCRR
jgi:hypothetical protein